MTHFPYRHIPEDKFEFLTPGQRKATLSYHEKKGVFSQRSVGLDQANEVLRRISVSDVKYVAGMEFWAMIMSSLGFLTEAEFDLVVALEATRKTSLSARAKLFRWVWRFMAEHLDVREAAIPAIGYLRSIKPADLGAALQIEAQGLGLVAAFDKATEEVRRRESEIEPDPEIVIRAAAEF